MRTGIRSMLLLVELTELRRMGCEQGERTASDEATRLPEQASEA